MQSLHTQFCFSFLFVPAIGRVLAYQRHRFFALTALCALSRATGRESSLATRSLRPCLSSGWIVWCSPCQAGGLARSEIENMAICVFESFLAHRRRFYERARWPSTQVPCLSPKAELPKVREGLGDIGSPKWCPLSGEPFKAQGQVLGTLELTDPRIVATLSSSSKT